MATETALQADRPRGVLATVLRKVVPPSCLALLVIWLLVGIGSDWVLQQRNVESLKAAAEQQTWAVADKVDHVFDALRSAADNALTVNAFVDPFSVEHFLQPFFRSFRIGDYRSLSITMTDFAGQVMASNRRPGDIADLPPEDRWLTPAIDGQDVLTIWQGGLVAAVPVRIGSLPEGVILATLSPDDTQTLLSSSKHGGHVTLEDEALGVIFDGAATSSSPGADVIRSATVDLPNFPGVSLSSAIVVDEETPFVGVLHGFLLAAFLADLAALVFGIFMAANLVASPLERLVTKIRSMEKLTDPGERLPIEGPTELKKLAQAFNAAADRQAVLTSSLEDALANEKEINDTQRQFVSLVSHEFRTPLAIIDGRAQRIIRRIDREPKDEIVASMHKCRTSVARLVGLMESVLSSSRLEAGKIEFRPGPCALADVIEDVAKGQEGIAPSHRILLDIDRLPETIEADEKLIRQIFTNLLSNAVKYSPNASQVWVEGRVDEGDAVVSVRDLGVGIPEKELGKLFGRFFRASTASGIAGTGIGLHLVKQLIEMHDGDIAVSSIADEGTTFTVRLPIAQSPEISAEAA